MNIVFKHQILTERTLLTEHTGLPLLLIAPLLGLYPAIFGVYVFNLPVPVAARSKA